MPNRNIESPCGDIKTAKLGSVDRACRGTAYRVDRIADYAHTALSMREA